MRARDTATQWLLVTALLLGGLLTGCGSTQPSPSSTPCGSENLRSTDQEPSFGEETVKRPGQPDAVTVRGRVGVEATSACSTGDWKLVLRIDGVDEPVIRSDARPVSVGTFPEGEKFTFEIRWAGPGDMNVFTPATLFVNGAGIPLQLPGWTDSPVTWRGPEVQSNRTGEPTPYSGLPDFTAS